MLSKNPGESWKRPIMESKPLKELLKGICLLTWPQKRDQTTKDQKVEKPLLQLHSEIRRIFYTPFSYIYHNNQPNIGRYTIHGYYGIY